MLKRLNAVLLPSILLATTAMVGPAGRADLTAHEWGTFTSVAGPDGRAVEWAPFGGPSDLPRFVTILNPLSIKTGSRRAGVAPSPSTKGRAITTPPAGPTRLPYRSARSTRNSSSIEVSRASPVPVAARVTADRAIAVEDTGREPIGLYVLFERRGGRLGYRIVHDSSNQLTIARAPLDIAPRPSSIVRVFVGRTIVAIESLLTEGGRSTERA